VAGMTVLAAFLEEQRSKDSEIAAKLTRLQLPNLLALLDWMSNRTTPEGIVGVASTLEKLIAPLGLPRTLAQVTAAREKAMHALAGWSHARAIAEGVAFDRLLERHELDAASTAAQQHLKELLQAGEDAYPEAASDIALAYFRLGRALDQLRDYRSAVSLLA